MRLLYLSSDRFFHTYWEAAIISMYSLGQCVMLIFGLSYLSAWKYFDNYYCMSWWKSKACTNSEEIYRTGRLGIDYIF